MARELGRRVPADVKVSPGGRAALRALYGAAIDPGELLWGELRVRVQTSDQGLARIAYRLQRDGLVTLESWDGHKYRVVRLTDLGGAVCKHLGFTCSPRT